MNLNAFYFTEMAVGSIERYNDTMDPFYLSLAMDFWDLAFLNAPEA